MVSYFGREGGRNNYTENELFVESFNAQLNDNLKDVFVSGRLPSEFTFQGIV